MTTALTETIGSTILDNYADVIEGGSSHRGAGTAYKGIPGTHSYHDWVKDHGTGLAVYTGGNSTTLIPLNGVPAAQAATMIRTSAPPFFILATTAATVGVTGSARKIASHDGTRTFTTAAFPGAVIAADTVSIVEGFKRCPDSFDIEGEPGEEMPGGFDRFFRLRVGPGERVEWTGNGIAMYRAPFSLDMRFQKRARQHADQEIAMQNAQRVAEIMMRGEHRGTYTQSLLLSGPIGVLKEDLRKVVVRVPFDLLYQVSSAFL